MARRGNGDGYGGPARGAGWGGPARGIGDNSARAAEFEPGNNAAAGEHSRHRVERRDAVINRLFDLALNSPSEEVQISAAIACLDRLLGPPLPMQEGRGA